MLNRLPPEILQCIAESNLTINDVHSLRLCNRHCAESVQEQIGISSLPTSVLMSLSSFLSTYMSYSRFRTCCKGLYRILPRKSITDFRAIDETIIDLSELWQMGHYYFERGNVGKIWA